MPVPQLTVSASSERFAADDERWAFQVDNLYRIVSDELPSETRREGAIELGTKGSVESVIVALGSAGAVSALVQCFKIWVDRDRTRKVKVKWVSGGEERSFSIDSTAVRPATVELLTEELTRQLFDHQ